MQNGQQSNLGVEFHFDGKGHTISGLYINRSSESYVGLFGYIKDGAQIMNVSLVDVNITGSSTVGGLIGGASGGSSVIRCSTSGTVTGFKTVGGLIGIREIRIGFKMLQHRECER